MRELTNYVGKKAIVSCPEIDQEVPVNFGEVLKIDQSILIVAGKDETALQSGSDEALMIVRG